jgi:hypothetical protein
VKLLLLVLTMTISVSAETVARGVLDAWLTAFNSGDRDTMLAYLQRYAPQRVKNLDDDMGFRQQTGGFTLVRVAKDSDTEIEALVKERQGETFARMRLEVEGDPPRVKGMGLRVVDTPEEARPAAADDARSDQAGDRARGRPGGCR